MLKNIFAALPSELTTEQCAELLQAKHVQTLRIERILSKGHTSPETGWYDQDEHEWVLVLEGAGTLLFAEGNRQVTLRKGDYLHIPAHARHKVVWTEPEKLTVWLAVHYSVEESTTCE